jgi:hypothetical protein
VTKIELNVDTEIARLSEDLKDLDYIIKQDTETFNALKRQIQENHQKIAQKIGALNHFQEIRRNLKEYGNPEGTYYFGEPIHGNPKSDLEIEEFPEELIIPSDLPPNIVQSIKDGIKDISGPAQGKVIKNGKEKNNKKTRT